MYVLSVNTFIYWHTQAWAYTGMGIHSFTGHTASAGSLSDGIHFVTTKKRTGQKLGIPKILQVQQIMNLG